MNNHMKNRYLGSWKYVNKMIEDFEIDIDELNGYDVIVAYYDNYDYDGSAFVLLEKNGSYFEVNGSHCSCHGLEGQWTLEETSEEALKYRYENGHSYGAFLAAKDSIKEYFEWSD